MTDEDGAAPERKVPLADFKEGDRVALHGVVTRQTGLAAEGRVDVGWIGYDDGLVTASSVSLRYDWEHEPEYERCYGPSGRPLSWCPQSGATFSEDSTMHTHEHPPLFFLKPTVAHVHDLYLEETEHEGSWVACRGCGEAWGHRA